MATSTQNRRKSKNLGFRVKGLVGILLLLLALVSAFSYISLRQSTDQITRLSDKSLPSLAATMELTLHLERIIQSSEKLMNAGIQAERRVAFQQTTAALEDSKSFMTANSTVASARQLSEILATLETTANDLNSIIQEKMDAAQAATRKRQAITRWLRDFSAGTDPAASDAMRAWNQNVVNILFQLAPLTPGANARDLRRHIAQLERQMRSLDKDIQSLPTQNRQYALSILSDLNQQLNGEGEFLTTIRQHSNLDLRAMALTRQMRVITDEMVRELNAQTTGEINDAQQSTSQLIANSEKRLTGLILVVLVAITIAVLTFLFIDRRVVQRLGQLQQSVQNRAAGQDVAVPLDGADEITEIAKAVRHFIDEISQREKSLIETAEKAEAATRSKSQFLAMMSHEIRSPMNGIISVAEILSRQKLDAEQRRLVNVINQSAETLLAIIDDILDFSKIEAGKLSIETLPFNLHTLLHSTTDLLAPELSQKGVSYDVEIGPTVPVYVEGDANRLRQILFNLIGNATKFTNEGSVRIRADKKDDDFIDISVMDTGIGIAPDALDRLFQPFEQADSSTARQYGGTGLGLSICRKLTELMQGKLAAESTPGKGTTFTISLPLPETEDRPTEAVPLAQPVATDQKHGRKVLVVEDNPINQIVIGKILSQLTIAFEVADNGVEALEKLDKIHYDLVLTDLRMPVMDGFTLARTIRERENGTDKRIPIIAVSADAMEEAQQESAASGIDTFIKKPIKVDEVRDCLARYMPG